MIWPLVYWLTVASVGVAAAVASATRGLRWARYIRQNRPELAATMRPELVRDWLLLGGLACNLATGIFALTHLTMGTTLSILAGATLFSGFAVLNAWLRR